MAMEYGMLDIFLNLKSHQDQAEVDFGTCVACGVIFIIDLYLENIQEKET